MGDVALPVRRHRSVHELAEVRTGSDRTTLGGTTVVGREHDDRVVEFAELGQGVDDASDALIDRINHGRIDLLVLREAFLLGNVELIPRWSVVAGLGVALGDRSALVEQTLLDLSVESSLAHSIPPVRVLSAILLEVGLLDLVRTVHGDMREVEEEGLLGIVRAQRLDLRDSTIGEIVGDVVVIGVLVDVDDRIVGDELVGIEERVQPFERTVIGVEPALQRPRIARTAGAHVGVAGEVPLTDRIRRIAVGAQYLRKREHVVGEFEAQTGEARIGVRHTAVAGTVRVEPRQQSGPSRRTDRRRVVIRQSKSTLCERRDVGGIDLRAERRDIGVAHVVDEHDDDVRSTHRRARFGLPPGRRLRRRTTDPTLETFVTPCVVGYFAVSVCHRHSSTIVRPPLSAVAHHTPFARPAGLSTLSPTLPRKASSA